MGNMKIYSKKFKWSMEMKNAEFYSEISNDKRFHPSDWQKLQFNI